MSRTRKGLKIDGVVLLDKPVGMSSNTALQKVKRKLNARKAGHTGTLDPLASGLLPLCFGEATKFSADLLDADKEYIAEVKFGERTTTGDLEGEVIETGPSKFSTEKILEALEAFKGEISQIPPMYSALKKDGVPLYRIARKGENIEREPRKVVISRLDLLKTDSDRITIRVGCSKGTYIRVLAEDIGKYLKTGAHLTGLRRTRVGKVTLERSITLDEILEGDEAKPDLLLPVDELISSLPAVELSGLYRDRFSHGGTVQLPATSQTGRVRVYEKSGQERRLMGVGRIDQDNRLIPERLVTLEN